MLNLNIDYSTAVILSTTQKRKATIEELREKCVENTKTQVMYDSANKRVIFRIAFATTLYKVQAKQNIMSPNIVAAINVSADAFAQNKAAYQQALYADILAGKLDSFITTQSNLISTRLTKAHAAKKSQTQH